MDRSQQQPHQSHISLNEAVAVVLRLAEAKWYRRAWRLHRLTDYEIRCIQIVSQQLEHGKWEGD